MDGSWISSVWEKLLGCFGAEIRAYDGAVAAYFMERNSHMGVAGRIYFHLVETQDDAYPFAFMATYSTKPAKSKKAVHTPLKHALMEFKADRDKLLSLLSSVAKAADKSALISELMESGELFSAIKFTDKEAYTFLKEIPFYEEAGIMCRVPDWWKRQTNSLRVSVSVGQRAPSELGVDALLDFNPSLMLGEEELSDAQLKEFLGMAEGLVQYKGRWVEINKERLNAALAAIEKARHLAGEGRISVAEAIRLEMTLKEEINTGREDVECTVTNGQWMKEPKRILRLSRIPVFRRFCALIRQMDSSGWT